MDSAIGTKEVQQEECKSDRRAASSTGSRTTRGARPENSGATGSSGGPIAVDANQHVKMLTVPKPCHRFYLCEILRIHGKSNKD